ncbi:MAG TPA: acyl-ACP--UDP-N-acetylglucosamine O-acyltransferase [Candidatus Limnocylindria bacterium]|jgi:UDP-N-acetylglucosamine acyltransferase|nr:acyl-ACP--UDP-N-acetylglucosamine O-acyltransferase [Candidatus Limnocylindria bacterium]
MSSATTRIHPTAVIDPHAEIDEDCLIGPGAVIDAHVRIGAGCRIGPGVYLTGHTTLGPGNCLHAGAVIGDAPQDLKYSGAPTRLRIGANNVFREHVTVHRSNKLEEDTQIGDGNLFMAGSHVGHNCILGNHNVLANGALLAGHVTLADRAFISGNCLVHQFCRVGRLALMQGGSAISKDLPPFCIARGDNGMAGLNTIGLRRAGFDSPTRLALRQLFKVLFRRNERMSAALERARREFAHEVCLEQIAFVAASRRGVCAATGRIGADEAGE